MRQHSASGNKKDLIIGRLPVMEAIEAGRMIDRIYLQKGAGGEIVQALKHLAANHSIPVNLVPPEKLNSLTRSNHQGVVAIAGLVSYLHLQDVIDLLNGNGQSPLFVMLDGVTDVRNIGGIARTSLCCGSQAMIIPDKGVGALNEEAMKSSAGALEKIHVCRESSLLKAIDLLHLNEIKVYTSEMNANKKVYEIDFGIPCCIIVGNEEKGVQTYLSKSADDRFTIPMLGNFNSFNVNVATGIILYEAMKQRIR